MIAFVVEVDGRRLACAGLGEDVAGVLSVHLDWVRRRPEDNEGLPAELWSQEELTLSVSGYRGADDHPRWLLMPVRPGNRIRLSAIEGREVDAPLIETYQQLARRAATEQLGARFEPAVAFDVEVADQRVVAAAGDCGVLHAVLDRVERRAETCPVDWSIEEWTRESVRFSLGALVRDEHLRWGTWQLKFGDHVSIEVREGVREWDAPAHRTARDGG